MFDHKKLLIVLTLFSIFHNIKAPVIFNYSDRPVNITVNKHQIWGLAPFGGRWQTPQITSGATYDMCIDDSDVAASKGSANLFCTNNGYTSTYQFHIVGNQYQKDYRLVRYPGPHVDAEKTDYIPTKGDGTYPVGVSPYKIKDADGIDLLSTNNTVVAGPVLNYLSPGSLSLANKTDKAVFITSNQGNGYQAMLDGSATVQATGSQSACPWDNSLGLTRCGTLVCQQPLGKQVPCVDVCDTKQNSDLIVTTGCTSTGTQNGKLDVSFVAGDVNNDFLNAKGTQNTNYVYLDTIINNSNYGFEIATTTAPLMASDDSEDDNEDTIYGALNSGALKIVDILKATEDPTKKILTNHSVNWISDPNKYNDNRYSIAPKNGEDLSQGYISEKRFMAQPELALATKYSMEAGPATTTQTNTTTTQSPAIAPAAQTIILFPKSWRANCQPVILIGRDQDNNAFYALTYLFNTSDPKSSHSACCKTADGTSCTQDTLLGICNQNGDCPTPALIKTQSFRNSIGKPGRLRIVIDPVVAYTHTVTDDKGNTSNITDYIMPSVLTKDFYDQNTFVDLQCTDNGYASVISYTPDLYKPDIDNRDFTWIPSNNCTYNVTCDKVTKALNNLKAGTDICPKPPVPVILQPIIPPDQPVINPNQPCGFVGICGGTPTNISTILAKPWGAS